MRIEYKRPTSPRARKLRHGAWLAALMLTLAGAQEAPVQQTPAQRPEASKVFKDWRVQCQKSEEGKELCFVFQDVMLKEGNRHLLRLEMGYVPDKKDQLVAIITVPLGIALPPGVLLKIDEGKELRLPVEHCIPQGCRVLFPVDQDLLGALKAGNQAMVTVHNMGHQPVQIPVSLSGFTAAFNSLK
jgi:invasion protein IalB